MDDLGADPDLTIDDVAEKNRFLDAAGQIIDSVRPLLSGNRNAFRSHRDQRFGAARQRRGKRAAKIALCGADDADAVRRAGQNLPLEKIYLANKLRDELRLGLEI